MKAFFTAILLLGFATPAWAHQLDEFLQATTIDVAKDHITLDMRLTPGADVFRAVFVEIDTNGDGVLTGSEQHAYADVVRKRLSLNIDGHDLPLVIVSSAFPKVDEMKAGVGDILLSLRADGIPSGATHRLKFVNRHQRGIAAYLVNCLVPDDRDVHIVKQDRNYNQSEYTLDYTQARQPVVAAQSGIEKTRSMRRGSMLIASAIALGACGFWIATKRSTKH